MNVHDTFYLLTVALSFGLFSGCYWMDRSTI